MVRKRRPRPKKGAAGGPRSDKEAWAAADWDHASLAASDMFPGLGRATPSERIARLEGIVRSCPDYYPALIDLGCRRVQEGDEEGARGAFDRALEALGRRRGRKAVVDAHYAIGRYLDDHLWFEAAIEYYWRLMELEEGKGKADVNDRLASSYASLGDLDEALELQRRAVALDGSNARLLCNLGWVEMLRGELEAAKGHLERSLAISSADEVAKGNYEALCTMLRNRRLKRWEGYLLRRADRRLLRRLRNGDDQPAYMRQVRTYNLERLDAFKLELARDPRLSPTKRHGLAFTLVFVLDHIQWMHEGEPFLFEDVGTVSLNLSAIMNSIIIRTSDIEAPLLLEMSSSLLAFYGFLARHGLVAGFEEMKEELEGMLPELEDRMQRYNEVRRDPMCTEADRREAREEIFEGRDSLLLL